MEIDQVVGIIIINGKRYYQIYNGMHHNKPVYWYKLITSTEVISKKWYLS